jgi:sporulation protein YlmC with PRC-barrel domain
MEMPKDNEPYGDDLYHDDLYTELLVSGSICLDHESDTAVEVKRGMAILTSEGREAGRVAAVIINRHDQQVTHILLSGLSQIPEYRLVSIALIEQVYEGKVLLRIFNQVVTSLPTWHGS